MVDNQLSDDFMKALNQAKINLNQTQRNLDIAQLQYDNVVLRIQIAYKLEEGDVISDTGEIVRKVNDPQQSVKKYIKSGLPDTKSVTKKPSSRLKTGFIAEGDDLKE